MAPIPIHLGWIPQGANYEMQIYAQEVYWGGLLGSEENRMVQREKLNYRRVATVNLSQSHRTSSVAGMGL